MWQIADDWINMADGGVSSGGGGNENKMPSPAAVVSGKWSDYSLVMSLALGAGHVS
jgi:hypothetical protein